MRLQRVCIIGGSGFIGRHLARQLDAQGIQVSIPTRSRTRRKTDLIVLPNTSLIESRIDSQQALEQLISGHDAVINLVGILHGSRQDFELAHSTLSANLVAACRQSGVSRLLQVSALGCSAQSTSYYQQSKAAGEQFVMRSELAWTVFRPSVVFGQGDQFLNLFARLCRVLPLIPLAGASTRFQPVWVEDVARAIAVSLHTPATVAQTLDLAGPRQYTLRQLVEYVGRICGHPRRVVPLPHALAQLQASLMECLPGPTLMSRDNLRSLQTDNISHQGFPASLLGFEPTALESVAAGFLAGKAA
jgi:uncharacterized protein YbjT (DUF2867 family)